MPPKQKTEPLKSWPESERPRERLLSQGVNVLSDAELLALFLRSGKPGENVRDLAMKLLRETGGLTGLARKSSSELLKISGLGPAKVASLVAAFEIGNRLIQEKILSQPRIESPDDLFEMLQKFFYRYQEEVLVGVLLNSKNEIIKTIIFSQGDFTNIIVSVPQVVRRLLLEGAPAVIFSHNHPSGDPTPSNNDKILTKKLIRALKAVEISMHDHIIVGKEKYFSFAEEGFLPSSS